MSCVAKDGRFSVGTGGGEDGLSSNASGTGPEKEMRVDNRNLQVLITIWRLTSVQVKSRGYNNAPHSTNALSSVAGGYVYSFCFGNLVR